MLHLAQVQNNENAGGVELRLLACQQSENSWGLINPETIPLTNTNFQKEGLLVLVELSENQDVLSIRHAKDWVLDLVQQYLTNGVTPAFLQEEAARTEQWRQDLTLQSQDLTRRHLEMEARREQIQKLEDDLKREKQQLLEEKAPTKSLTIGLSDEEREKLEKLAKASGLALDDVIRQLIKQEPLTE